MNRSTAAFHPREGRSVIAVVLMAAVLALPAVRAAGQDAPPVPLGDLERANEGLRRFQEGMLADRERMARKLQRDLRRKIQVPPPARPVPKVQTIPSFADLLPSSAKVGISIVAEMSIGRDDGPHLTAKRKTGIAVSTADPGLVLESERDFAASLWMLSADRAGKTTAALVFSGVSLSQDTEGNTALNASMGSGWFGLSLSGEEVELTEGVGFSLDPNRFLHLKIGLETGQTLSWADEVERAVSFAAYPDSSRDWASSRRTRNSVLLVIREPQSCPWCEGDGEFHCPQCSDARTVPCRGCTGSGKVACGDCDKSGWVSCPTTVSCSSCGGDGYLDCTWCRGTGRIGTQTTTTCWKCGGSGWVTQSEYFPNLGYLEVAHGCPTCGGIWGYVDSSGNVTGSPGSGTVTTTTYVDCSSCGGTGRGAACGTCGGTGRVTCPICNGSGWRPCPRCGGTGLVDCRTCRGTGRLECPFCNGEPIRCRLCRGKRRVEPALPRAAPPPLPPWAARPSDQARPGKKGKSR